MNLAGDCSTPNENLFVEPPRFLKIGFGHQVKRIAVALAFKFFENVERFRFFGIFYSNVKTLSHLLENRKFAGSGLDFGDNL